MPTSYTAKLYAGEAQTFEEFVLTCARAMGVAITMREDPMDVPIPDEFKPSAYHSEALTKVEERLRDLDGLTLDQAAVRAKEDHDRAVKAQDESNREKAERKARYEAMLKQVQAWEPPTEDHVKFKEFMVEQLSTSINFDCSDYEWTLPSLDPWEWLHNQKAIATREVAYHAKAQQEEYERATQRTAWVRALRVSLIGTAE